MRTAIPVPPGVDVDGVFAFLVPRAIPGVEIGEPDRHARALPTSDGVVGLDVRRTADGLDVHTTGTDAPSHAAVLERVRRLFGLTAGAPASIAEEAAAIDAALSRDPRIAPLVAARPGIRPPTALVPEETLVRAVVGQQISVAAARLAVTELSAVGEPVDVDIPGIERRFPSPARLTDGGFELLRGPASRRATLASVTRALADGELVLGAHVDRDALQAQLLAMRGIGPWTVGYVSLFALGDPDVWLPGDSALRLGGRRLGIESGDLPAFASGFAPWRSYLAMHVWGVAAG